MIMVLDFKEIPEANKGTGLQDTFELFTRDFLSFLGYRIVQDPDRGADGKKDLIVDEVISGITSEYTIRWLVSCKHYAHSSNSVKDSDEINISDRLKQHHCDGFMGVYSTLAATSLTGMLQGQEKYVIFDHEKIESFLLSNIEGHKIACRYFPESFKKYQIENPTPAKIFGEESVIYCDCCGKNLLLESEHGNYVLLKEEDYENDGYQKQYKDMYFACRGECDRILEDRFRKEGMFYCGWEEIDELCNPTIWLMHFMAFVNGIQKEHDMSDVAFEKMKKLFINTYPYVARHLTQKENERVKTLLTYGLM